MEYIATAALITACFVLGFIAVGVVIISRAIDGFINSRLTVHLCQEDRDLLANYRRYAPRAKKETV